MENNNNYPYFEVSKLLALAYWRRYIIYQKRLDNKEFPSINTVKDSNLNGENNHE